MVIHALARFVLICFAYRDAPNASRSKQKENKTMTEETKKATDFGADVFGEEAIRTYLSKETAKKLQATIREGKPLDPSIAGEVAHGIRHWAMDRGATHYTH